MTDPVTSVADWAALVVIRKLHDEDIVRRGTGGILRSAECDLQGREIPQIHTLIPVEVEATALTGISAVRSSDSQREAREFGEIHDSVVVAITWECFRNGSGDSAGLR